MTSTTRTRDHRTTARKVVGSPRCCRTDVLGRTEGGTLTLTASTDRAWVDGGLRIVVTTLTGYGWTAPSAPSATVAC